MHELPKKKEIELFYRLILFVMILFNLCMTI